MALSALSNSFVKIIGVGLLLISLSGCANLKTVQGVNSPWADEVTQDWRRGNSTQADVLEALGPPSQLIALHDGTVLYYLRERGTGSTKIFILYNTADLKVEYDRAIFFFDSEGVLTDYSYSEE